MYNLRSEDIAICWSIFLESNPPKYTGLEVILGRKKSCTLTCLHITQKMLYQYCLEIIGQKDWASRLEGRNQNQILRFLDLDLWFPILLDYMKLLSLLKLSQSFGLIQKNQMGSLKKFLPFEMLYHMCLMSKRILIGLCYLEIELV